MAVYVDPLVPAAWRFERACHLYGDTERELHDFAARLGLKREWFSDDPRLPHYDLAPGKRRQAVRMGAIEQTRQQLGERVRRNWKIQAEGLNAMQTHRDEDYDAVTKRLERRAEECKERGESQIASGRPGEEFLLDTIVRFDTDTGVQAVRVARLPDDPDALRISVGGIKPYSQENVLGYLVFRGDPDDVHHLMTLALCALERVLERDDEAGAPIDG